MGNFVNVLEWPSQRLELNRTLE